MKTIEGNNQWIFIPRTDSSEYFQEYVPVGSVIITNYDDVHNDPSLNDIIFLDEYESLGKLGSEYFPLLPDPSTEDPIKRLIEAEKFYSYNGKIVQCIQTHERTIYPPEETPALFSFYREDTGDLEWIANERVAIGDIRIYNDIKYEVIQAHITQETWTPDVTAALWTYYTDDISEWVQPTGAHDAYNIGDKVIFENAVWESLIDANTWSPTVYPAGWEKLYDL